MQHLRLLLPSLVSLLVFGTVAIVVIVCCNPRIYNQSMRCTMHRRMNECSWSASWSCFGHAHFMLQEQRGFCVRFLHSLSQIWASLCLLTFESAFEREFRLLKVIKVSPRAPTIPPADLPALPPSSVWCRRIFSFSMCI